MMYDFIIELISTLFKHGLSLSSAGAIVFLLLKQRKLKKRMRRFFPWMFEDDSEMKIYAGNQLILLENQSRIMQKLGVECVNGPLTKSSNQVQRNLNIFAKLSQVVTVQVSQRRKSMKKIIVIDAGHGSKDPGALGSNGKNEKTFVLIMALKVEKLLLNNPSIEVVLTRRTDVLLELTERSNIANNKKADAFISIHANSADNTTATGTETFYYKSDSKVLANVIHKHLIEATGLRDRGVKTGNFYVIRNTKMPAALIEVGFINNIEDEAKLFDPAYQDKVALSVAKGICEFFGIAYEIQPTPAPQPVPDKSSPYPEMEVTVHTDQPRTFVGYNIKGTTWIPSRPIGELLSAVVGYKKGKVIINDTAVETQLINSVGYVTARDLSILLGARVFWDKASPKRVEIYPKLGA